MSASEKSCPVLQRSLLLMIFQAQFGTLSDYFREVRTQVTGKSQMTDSSLQGYPTLSGISNQPVRKKSLFTLHKFVTLAHITRKYYAPSFLPQVYLGHYINVKS